MIFFILILIKHFLADVLLQTGWISSGKRERGIFYVIPLFFHCMIHGIGTYLVVLYVTRSIEMATAAELFDMFWHAVIDRIKSHPDLNHLWDDPKVGTYWMVMCLDQALHFATYCAIWVLFVRG